MTFFTGFAVYFLIWWLTLFAVLPFGVRSQVEEGEVEPGTDPGAPKQSRIGLKLAINTVVSAAVFVLIWLAGELFGIGLDSLPSPFEQG